MVWFCVLFRLCSWVSRVVCVVVLLVGVCVECDCVVSYRLVCVCIVF